MVHLHSVLVAPRTAFAEYTIRFRRPADGRQRRAESCRESRCRRSAHNPKPRSIRVLEDFFLDCIDIFNLHFKGNFIILEWQF